MSFSLATHYFEEIEYENNNLQAVYHEDGRIVPLAGTTYEYHFYLKDHLGNIRTVVKGIGAAPMLIQVCDIFEPCFSRKPQGLGLSSTLNIVQLHGSAIEGGGKERYFWCGCRRKCLSGSVFESVAPHQFPR